MNVNTMLTNWTWLWTEKSVIFWLLYRQIVVFSQKKDRKRPRAFGLFGSVFGRSGPGKNGSVRAVFKDWTEDRPITSLGGLSDLQRAQIFLLIQQSKLPTCNELIKFFWLRSTVGTYTYTYFRFLHFQELHFQKWYFQIFKEIISWIILTHLSKFLIFILLTFTLSKTKSQFWKCMSKCPLPGHF